MSSLEIIGTCFGIACVWLCIYENIWSWPTGLVQVILFTFVFYQSKLYSDFVLHIIYAILQIYGWYHWLKPTRDGKSLDVTQLTVRERITWLSIAAAGTLIWGYIMATYTDAAVPYPDASIAAMSLVAQYLMTVKKLESWIFWIVVDVIAIGVYSYKGLYFITALYCVFLVMACKGYIEWKRSAAKSLQSAGT